MTPTSNDRIRLLLTGATGCVGSAVLRLAAQRPDLEVWALTRSGDLPSVRGDAHAVTGSLRELPDRLRDLPPMHACVHTAAAVHGQVVDPDEMFRINRLETLALAGALAARGELRQFAFASTVAIEMIADGEPPDPYADSKHQAEVELQRLAPSLGFQAASLRLATVYGPGDRGNIRRLFDAIRRRRYLRVVPPETPKSLLWVDRAATALLAAADATTPVPDVSVIADPRPYCLVEIEMAMAEAAGVPMPPRLSPIAAWPAAAAGSLLEALSGRRAPLTIRRLQTLRRPAEFTPRPAGELQTLVAGVSIPLVDAFRTSYMDD